MMSNSETTAVLIKSNSFLTKLIVYYFKKKLDSVNYIKLDYNMFSDESSKYYFNINQQVSSVHVCVGLETFIFI